MLHSITESATSHHVSEDQIDALLENAFDTRVTDILKAIELAEQAEQASVLSHYDHGRAYAQCYQGFFYMINSEHGKARDFCELCRPYFEKFNKKSGLALSLYTIGSCHYKTDDYHLALKFILQSLELYQADDNLLGQSRALKVIGTLYEFFGDYKKAEVTYLQCVETSKKIGDKNGMSNAYNPLSGLYLRKNENDMAMGFIDKSIALKTSTGDKRGLAYAYYGKAKVHLAEGDFDKAEGLFLDSLDIHDEIGDLVGAMMSLNKLGYACFRIKKFKNAQIYLNEALVKGDQSNHFLITYKAYKTLYLIAKEEGNIEEALEYLERHNFYKDQIMVKETKSVISSIQSISQVELLSKEAKWQKQKKEELERKNAELDAFVYKVAHDLRGPISSLMGLYNIVELDIEDPAAMAYFKMYNQHIHRLNDILLDFINLIQIKEKKIETVSIDLTTMVSQCIESFKFLPAYQKIDFQVTIEDVGSVMTDKSTMNTIIQNLIENAIKYSRPDNDPFVRVDIAKDESSEAINIKVEDNGIGIREKNRAKIFDMFFREYHKIQGTGLGLYLLKCAVEKLSGKITFDSKEGVGTTFVISVPRVTIPLQIAD